VVAAVELRPSERRAIDVIAPRSMSDHVDCSAEGSQRRTCVDGRRGLDTQPRRGVALDLRTMRTRDVPMD
jgi:hypothetical protein